MSKSNNNSDKPRPTKLPQPNDTEPYKLSQNISVTKGGRASHGTTLPPGIQRRNTFDITQKKQTGSIKDSKNNSV